MLAAELSQRSIPDKSDSQGVLVNGNPTFYKSLLMGSLFLFKGLLRSCHHVHAIIQVLHLIFELFQGLPDDS